MNPDGSLPRVTRRRLLQGGGLVAAATAVSRGWVTRTALQTLPLADTTPGTTWDLLVVRPVDGLRIRFTFNGYDVVDGVLVAEAQNSSILLEFPSQHTTEEVSTGTPVIPVADELAAPPSVIAMTVNQPVPYTLAGLLDLTDRPLVLDRRGETDRADALDNFARPADDVTRLVLPEGLWLTPADPQARFEAVATPRTIDTFGPGGTLMPTSDAFRVRLGRDDGGVFVPGDVDVRAIWTPGFAWGMDIFADGADDPFARAITQDQLKQLVRAMSEYSDTTYPDHEPAQARRLELTSAHGGTLDASGSWNGTGDLAAWEHRALLGRDVYVKIVSRGYLAPFGHLATVVQVTERTFALDGPAGDNNTDVQAALVKREFLSLVPGTQDIPAALMAAGGREFPFVSATLTTGGLLEIDRRAIEVGGTTLDTEQAFLAEAAGSGAPLSLAYTLNDRVPANEAPIEASFPAVWITASEAYDTSAGSVLDRLLDWFAESGTRDTRTVDLGGERVGYADEREPGSGASTYATLRQVWRVVRPAAGVAADALAAVGFPAFLPDLEVAEVRDAVLDAVTGNVEDLAGRAIEVVLSSELLDEALDNALDKVFDLTEPVTIAFEGLGDGFANPAFVADNFNQLLGFASDLLEPGELFDPRDLLDLSNLPKLLGILPLDRLLGAIQDVVPEPPDLPGAPSIPGLTVEFETTDIGGGIEVPTKLIATFQWGTPVGDFEVGGTKVLDAAPDTELSLVAQTCITYDGSPPSTTLDLFINDIVITAPPQFELIAVEFAEVRLTHRSGESLQVIPTIREIRLVGLLTLLDVLQSLIDFEAAGIDIVETDREIRASMGITVPDINLGVLVIRSISLNAGVTIPIVLGEPVTTNFSVGTLDDPVTVVVLGYGGAFSLEIEAAPAPASFELMRLSVSVVFEQSIDIIVAKGSLSASFGAFIEVLPIDVDDGDGGLVPSIETILGGYVEVVGSLKVLGVATITIGASITLTYSTLTQILKGVATVFVEVDVKLAKKEVELTFEQEFELGGGGARMLSQPAGKAVGARAPIGVRPKPGPGGSGTGGGNDQEFSFTDRFDDPTWRNYCDTFVS